MLMAGLATMYFGGLFYVLIAAIVLLLWKFNAVLYDLMIALLKYAFKGLFFLFGCLYLLFEYLWSKFRGSNYYKRLLRRKAIKKFLLQKNP